MRVFFILSRAAVETQINEVDFELWEQQFETLGVSQDVGQPEVYGRSMHIMREAGRVALQGSLDSLHDDNIERLRDEFSTAVNEMLKTADGLGEHVMIERCDSFDVKEGVILAKNGESVKGLVSRGVEHSRAAGETEDKRMLLQAARDNADLQLLTDYVEPMFSGARYNTVLAVSAFPEDGIKHHGTKFWRELGYNTEFECAMLQMYHKSSDGTLDTRVLSIDKSNVGQLAVLLRKFGANVPTDVSPTDLINHPILGTMSHEQASELMDGFVGMYETTTGQKHKISTVQLARNHQSLIDRSFESMYLPVAKSLAMGVKLPELTTFVEQIIGATSSMDYANQCAIRSIAARQEFASEDARVMHGAVLYALAEMLRDRLVNGDSAQHITLTNRTGYHIMPVRIHAAMDNQAFILQMGGHFNKGVASGRSYGGCGALFDFNDSSAGTELGMQDVFGGKDKPDNGEDKYGSLEFLCKKGHVNRRPPNKLIEHCQKCGDSVRC